MNFDRLALCPLILYVLYLIDNVNLQIVWDVIQKDIPRLKLQIRQILDDFQP